MLSQARIGVFVISTFDTDYVLVKSENEANAKEALAHAGYDILKPEGNRSLSNKPLHASFPCHSKI